MDEEERQVQTGAIPQDTFEHRLMLARSHAGRLTIQEAAAKCGFRHQSWSNWERGMKPRDIIDVAEVVSEKLGVDRDWLLFGGQLATPDARPLRRAMVRPNKRSGALTDRPMSGPPRVKSHPNGGPRNTVPVRQRRPAPTRSSARRMAA